jgi:hypothetical protein
MSGSFCLPPEGLYHGNVARRVLPDNGDDNLVGFVTLAAGWNWVRS